MFLKSRFDFGLMNSVVSRPHHSHIFRSNDPLKLKRCATKASGILTLGKMLHERGPVRVFIPHHTKSGGVF